MEQNFLQVYMRYRAETIGVLKAIAVALAAANPSAKNTLLLGLELAESETLKDRKNCTIISPVLEFLRAQPEPGTVRRPSA